MSTLIAFGGKKASGKDATSDFIVEQHAEFVKVGMSEGILKAALILNPLVRVSFAQAWMLSLTHRVLIRRTMRLEKVVTRLDWTLAKSVPDIRAFLQRLGTDFGRNMISQDIWVDERRRTVRELLASGTSVVLTGIRFPNELEVVRMLDGTSVWVHRPDENTKEKSLHSDHETENSISKAHFDMEIENNGSLNDLKRASDKLVTKVNGDGKE